MAASCTGKEKVKIRAADCYLKHGGRWFAEEFIDGREFNIAVLQGPDGPAVLPMAEMVFEALARGPSAHRRVHR